MKIMKKKLGLVVGRFQPLHAGHKHLLAMAINGSDLAVVCMGSPRRTDPLALRERRKRVLEFLKRPEFRHKKIRVMYVKDNHSDEKWVRDLVRKGKITNRTQNIFFSADNRFAKSYISALKKHNISLNRKRRIKFDYWMPDGRSYKVSSATDIRSLHKKYGLAL